MALGALPHQHGAHYTGAAQVGQGGSTPERTADQRQADYFLALLVQTRREIDDWIDRYRTATAAAEARHELGRADHLRRLLHLGEKELQVLDGLIDDLQPRFPRSRPPGFP